MRASGQKLVNFCARTHTHTHAAKLVVEMKLLVQHDSTATYFHERIQ